MKISKHFKKRQVPELEQLACEMVGDGKKPNVFFVSLRGQMQMITRDGDAAYELVMSYCWRHPNKEFALEDRLHGCLVTNEPEEDGSKKLILIDDYERFIKEKD